MVFTTPAIGALRRRFPDAHLPISSKHLPNRSSRTIPISTRSSSLERPRGLARLRYDLQLAARFARNVLTSRSIFMADHAAGFSTWATARPQRIGYDLPGRGWCYTTRMPWTRSLVPPRHSVLNQWDLLTPLGIEAAGSPARSGDDDRRCRRECARRLRGSRPPASRPARRSSSCTSAPATRSAAGRRHRSPQVAAALARRRTRAPHNHHVRAIRGRRRRSGGTAGTVAGRRCGCRHRARPVNSIWPSCARWSIAPRSTSAATAVRSTWPPPRGRRSSRCSARPCPSDRCHGAIRRSARSPWTPARCPAAPATSGTACRATFAV